MAIPQLEDGYTQIANEILDAFCRYFPAKSEGRVLWFVLRKTYGWGKPSDMISISQIVEATNLSTRMVIYALQNLEAKKMITIKRKRGRGIKNEINRISFQKNHDLWVVQEKSTQYQKAINNRKLRYKKSKEKVVQETLSGAGNGGLVVQEIEENGGFLAHTKEKKKTKEIYSQNSDEFRLSELLFNFILKRNPGHRKPDLQKWALHIDRMVRLDNRETKDIEVVIGWCQSDTSEASRFWNNNILCTEKLRAKFDQLKLKMEADSAKSKTSLKFTGLVEKNYNEGTW